MNLFFVRLFQDPVGEQICSLTTKVHRVAVTLFLTFLDESKKEKVFGYRVDLDEEASYCDYPATTHEFWDYAQERTNRIFGAELEELMCLEGAEEEIFSYSEELPLLQNEEELIRMCFAYCLSLPKEYWTNGEFGLFSYHFVQKVILKGKKDKEKTLEILREFLKDTGVLDQRRISEGLSPIYFSEMENNILRLLAVNRGLASPKNRWIWDKTERIVRTYWKLRHQSKLVRTIHTCVENAFSSLYGKLPNLGYQTVFWGNVIIKVDYTLQGEEDTMHQKIIQDDL